jgi:nicotinate-nucleotide adenylyltransferase
LKKSTHKNINVGLFGGTFNPIHWGHLRSAEEIREHFNLSEVIFIPVHIPPHKKPGVISSQHRFGMVKRAIRGNPFFKVSDIELRRPGKSYSIDTIRHFHGLSGNRRELFFIMGSDAFREISTWKDYPDFFSTCNFVIMVRPGTHDVAIKKFLPRSIQKHFVYKKGESRFVHASGYSICLYRVTPLDISSSEIRNRVQAGQSITYLLPAAVEQYISRQHLYHAG